MKLTVFRSTNVVPRSRRRHHHNTNACFSGDVDVEIEVRHRAVQMPGSDGIFVDISRFLDF